MSDSFNFDEFELEEELESIIFKNENDEDEEFIILNVLEHNNSKYLLAISNEDYESEEGEAIILKEISYSKEDDEYLYDFIEDETEFDEIVKLFEKSSDEYEIDI